MIIRHNWLYYSMMIWKKWLHPTMSRRNIVKPPLNECAYSHTHTRIHGVSWNIWIIKKWALDCLLPRRMDLLSIIFLHLWFNWLSHSYFVNILWLVCSLYSSCSYVWSERLGGIRKARIWSDSFGYLFQEGCQGIWMLGYYLSITLFHSIFFICPKVRE